MSDKFEKHLGGLDDRRREAVRELVRTSAFSAPAASTFSFDPAHAAIAVPFGPNSTFQDWHPGPNRGTEHLGPARTAS